MRALTPLEIWLRELGLRDYDVEVAEVCMRVAGTGPPRYRHYTHRRQAHTQQADALVRAARVAMLSVEARAAWRRFMLVLERVPDARAQVRKELDAGGGEVERVVWELFEQLHTKLARAPVIKRVRKRQAERAYRIAGCGLVGGPGVFA